MLKAEAKLKKTKEKKRKKRPAGKALPQSDCVLHILVCAKNLSRVVSSAFGSEQRLIQGRLSIRVPSSSRHIQIQLNFQVFGHRVSVLTPHAITFGASTLQL
jgi:hypothetical protein